MKKIHPKSIDSKTIPTSIDTSPKKITLTNKTNNKDANKNEKNEKPKSKIKILLKPTKTDREDDTFKQKPTSKVESKSTNKTNKENSSFKIFLKDSKKTPISSVPKTASPKTSIKQKLFKTDIPPKVETLGIGLKTPKRIEPHNVSPVQVNKTSTPPTNPNITQPTLLNNTPLTIPTNAPQSIQNTTPPTIKTYTKEPTSFSKTSPTTSTVDGSWELKVFVELLDKVVVLRVKSEMRIGMILLMTVEKTDKMLDWDSCALWWPEKNKWLRNTRNSLQQLAVTSDSLLLLLCVRGALHVQLPDLCFSCFTVDYSVDVFTVVANLCQELGNTPKKFSGKEGKHETGNHKVALKANKLQISKTLVSCIRHPEEWSLRKIPQFTDLKNLPSFPLSPTSPDQDALTQFPPIKNEHVKQHFNSLNNKRHSSQQHLNRNTFLNSTFQRKKHAPSVDNIDDDTINNNNMDPAWFSLKRGSIQRFSKSSLLRSTSSTLWSARDSMDSSLNKSRFDFLFSDRISVQRAGQFLHRPRNIIEKTKCNSNWLDSSKSIMEQGIWRNGKVQLMFKFHKQHDLNPSIDEGRLELLWEQLKWMVLLDAVECTKEEAVLFAALQLQIMKKRVDDQQSTGNLSSVNPEFNSNGANELETGLDLIDCALNDLQMTLEGSTSNYKHENQTLSNKNLTNYSKINSFKNTLPKKNLNNALNTLNKNDEIKNPKRVNDYDNAVRDFMKVATSDTNGKNMVLSNGKNSHPIENHKGSDYEQIPHDVFVNNNNAKNTANHFEDCHLENLLSQPNADGKNLKLDGFLKIYRPKKFFVKTYKCYFFRLHGHILRMFSRHKPDKCLWIMDLKGSKVSSRVLLSASKYVIEIYVTSLSEEIHLKIEKENEYIEWLAAIKVSARDEWPDVWGNIFKMEKQYIENKLGTIKSKNEKKSLAKKNGKNQSNESETCENGNKLDNSLKTPLNTNENEDIITRNSIETAGNNLSITSSRSSFFRRKKSVDQNDRICNSNTETGEFENNNESIHRKSFRNFSMLKRHQSTLLNKQYGNMSSISKSSHRSSNLTILSSPLLWNSSLSVKDKMSPKKLNGDFRNSLRRGAGKWKQLREILPGRVWKKSGGKAIALEIEEAGHNLEATDIIECMCEYINAVQALPDYGKTLFAVEIDNGKQAILTITPTQLSLCDDFNKKNMRDYLKEDFEEKDGEQSKNKRIWPYSSLVSWSVNWQAKQVQLSLEDDEVNFKCRPCDCKQIHEFIGGYIFLSLRNKSDYINNCNSYKQDSLNAELFHRLTGGWK